MNTSELEKHCIQNPLTRKLFGGVMAFDQLPNPTKAIKPGQERTVYIVNPPGQHMYMTHNNLDLLLAKPVAFRMHVIARRSLHSTI